MASFAQRSPTMRELIAEHGVHCGGQRKCSLCGMYVLHRVPGQGGAGWFLACNYCDVERDA